MSVVGEETERRGEERRGESIGEHGLNMTHPDTCECLCWGSCIEIIDITAALRSVDRDPSLDNNGIIILLVKQSEYSHTETTVF